MPLIVFPPSYRTRIYWLVNLVVARGTYNPVRLVIAQTLFIPVQSTVADNLTRESLCICNHFLVAYLQHWHPNLVTVIIHQSFVFDIVSPQVSQVIGKIIGAGKLLKVAGETGIHWITCTMDNPRIRK